VWLDLRLLWLTGAGIVSRRYALDGVSALLARLGADPELVQVALRTTPLDAVPPPGVAQAV
jgi:hypothetical protein